MRVGSQIAEAVRAHNAALTRDEVNRRSSPLSSARLSRNLPCARGNIHTIIRRLAAARHDRDGAARVNLQMIVSAPLPLLKAPRVNRVC